MYEIQLNKCFLNACRATWHQEEQDCWDFPGGPVVEIPSSNAGDAGSIPGWGTKIPGAIRDSAAIFFLKEQDNNSNWVITLL